MPLLTSALISGALLMASSAAVLVAGSRLSTAGASAGFNSLLVIAAASLAASLGFDIAGHWRVGLRPDAGSHQALIYLGTFLQAQLVAPLIVMAGFVLVRSLTRRLSPQHRVSFDNLAVFWHYAVGQGLLGLLLIHGFPRAL